MIVQEWSVGVLYPNELCRAPNPKHGQVRAVCLVRDYKAAIVFKRDKPGVKGSIIRYYEQQPIVEIQTLGIVT